MRSTGHKAPPYIIFSTPLLPRPSYIKIPSWATYSPTPSVSLPPALDVTDQKFYTHTKQQAKLHLRIFQCTYSWIPTGRYKILNQMRATNPWVQSAFNFFINWILMGCSQISELLHQDLLSSFIRNYYSFVHKWIMLWRKDFTICMALLQEYSKFATQSLWHKSPRYSFCPSCLKPWSRQLTH